MKQYRVTLGLVALGGLLAGCAAMKEGMKNLNAMAQAQQAEALEQTVKTWKADIAQGHYSGKVRIALIAVLPPKTGKTGIDPAKAEAMIRKDFGANSQIVLLDDKLTQSIQHDLGLDASSMDAKRVQSGTKQRTMMGQEPDFDVVLQVGLKLESFVGMNSAGGLGQGAKIVCWSDYMVPDGDAVSHDRFETTNIFKNEEPVQQAAAAFHKAVLDRLMVDRERRLLAQAEGAQPKP